jgi:hypothetical protein
VSPNLHSLKGFDIKPLRRIRGEVELSFLWTDDDIGATSPIFDQRDHTGTGS